MNAREFIVFAIGDPAKASTWSNVPYFLSKTLEEKGHVLHRADLAPNRPMQVAYDALIGALRKTGITRTRHYFFRSSFNAWLTQRRIERVLRAHPKALPIFTTFSFGRNRQRRPYVQFCDMTFERHLRYFEKRGPNAMEERTIARERKHIGGAALLVSLFPEQAEELKAQHGDRVRYYGNVVNTDIAAPDAQRLLHRDLSRPEVLFIGGSKYKPGLLKLLDVLETMNASRALPIQLHAVGIPRHELLRAIPSWATVHGYLDKSDPEDAARYTGLLERCCLFINPMPLWGSFSASCEAMHMHMPVIVSAYPEFTSTFGKEPGVGILLRTEEDAELSGAINNLLENPAEWRASARAAHETVNPFTWTNYVDRLLNDIGLLQPTGPTS
ncbi:MAG: glycosyltransferase family 4 protein [Flavobacteriales bacterium]|nr:MAG: glycosyltransferase family 4 protein [Flavobacteriales bacterium]